MSDLFSTAAAIGSTAAIAAGLFLGWTRTAKQKDEKLEASKMETITLLMSNRDAWKEKYETEHDDFKKYRDYTHKQISEGNVKLLECTEQNSALKAKTDITLVMDSLKQMMESMNQSSGNQLKMIEILGIISERLNVPSNPC